MSAEGPAFTIARDPLPTYILLGVTCAAALLSLIAAIVDVASGRQRARTLLHGVAKSTETFTRPRTGPLPDSPPPSSQAILAIPGATPTRQDLSVLSDTPKPISASRSSVAITAPSSRTVMGAAVPNPPSAPSVIPSRPRGRRRLLLCTVLSRLLFVAVVLSALALSLMLLVRYFRDGHLSSVAHRETNYFVHDVVRAALARYAADATRPELIPSDTNFGVGQHLVTPGEIRPTVMWRWVAVITSLVVFCLGGAFLSVAKPLVSSPRTVAVVMMAQAIVVLLVGMIAGFTFPTALPLDGSPIENKWLDRFYADSDLVKTIDENRLLSNFYIAAQNATSGNSHHLTQLHTLPRMSYYFCAQFNAENPMQDPGADSPLVPSSAPSPSPVASMSPAAAAAPTPAAAPTSTGASTVPTPTAAEPAPDDNEGSDGTSGGGAPADEDDRPTQAPVRSKRAVRQNGPSITVYEEMFLGYVIGKPGGTDHLRALGFAALPALAIAPVAAGWMLRTYILYPIFGAWVATVGVIMVIAVPTMVRVAAAPVRPKKLFTFCNKRYRLLIADAPTMRMARMEVAIFVLAVLVGILQGFRWLREAERRADDEQDDSVKLVNVEEVYSKSGNLRW